MIILGIDPGMANVGYGIIKTRETKHKGRDSLKHLGYGLIKTSPSLATPERLKKINNDLNKILKKYRPDILAIENVYFFKNLKTAMPVSQAKGVIMLAAAKKKIPVCELAPLQIKMAVTGYGKAEKTQIQRMTKALLGLKEIPRPDDAADALATALCCASLMKKQKRLDRPF